MTHLLREPSPHEINEMTSRLKVLAALKRGCANLSISAALAGPGLSRENRKGRVLLRRSLRDRRRLLPGAQPHCLCRAGAGWQRRKGRVMGKRSNIIRVKNEYFRTFDPRACAPLGPLLQQYGVRTHAEPCCGLGDLIWQLIGLGLTCFARYDINPRRPGIPFGDARTLSKADLNGRATSSAIRRGCGPSCMR